MGPATPPSTRLHALEIILGYVQGSRLHARIARPRAGPDTRALLGTMDILASRCSPAPRRDTPANMMDDIVACLENERANATKGTVQ